MALLHQEMCRMYLEGQTQTQIGEHWGVTQQTVSDILRRGGLGRLHGGADKKHTERLGISAHERRVIHAQFGRQPFRAYKDHRTNARRRWITFNLTFGQWWEIWQKSGHWQERGRHDGHVGYVMSRIGDTGAYSPENVMIVTASANTVEYHEHRKFALEMKGA